MYFEVISLVDLRAGDIGRSRRDQDRDCQVRSMPVILYFVLTYDHHASRWYKILRPVVEVISDRVTACQGRVKEMR